MDQRQQIARCLELLLVLEDIGREINELAIALAGEVVMMERRVF